MSRIKTEYKRQLSDLIAAGHRKFGRVLPRRPYLDDDEGGGEGGSALVFETHPLLSQQPAGATSDLTFIVENNKYALDEAEKRIDEATPQLRKQLEMKLGLEKQKKFDAKPTPVGVA
jgi:hypothetical protein